MHVIYGTILPTLHAAVCALGSGLHRGRALLFPPLCLFSSLSASESWPSRDWGSVPSALCSLTIFCSWTFPSTDNYHPSWNKAWEILCPASDPTLLVCDLWPWWLFVLTVKGDLGCLISKGLSDCLGSWHPIGECLCERMFVDKEPSPPSQDCTCAPVRRSWDSPI